MRGLVLLLFVGLALAGCGSPPAEAPAEPREPERSSEGVWAGAEFLATGCTGHGIGAHLPAEVVAPYLPPGYETGPSTSYVGLEALGCTGYTLTEGNESVAGGAELRLAWLSGDVAGPAVQQYVWELYVDAPTDARLAAALHRFGWDPQPARITLAADGFRIEAANATYAAPFPLPIPDGNQGSTPFTYGWHHLDAAQAPHEARLTFGGGFGGSVAVPGMRPSQVEAEGGVLGAFQDDHGAPFTGVIGTAVSDVAVSFRS